MHMFSFTFKIYKHRKKNVQHVMYLLPNLRHQKESQKFSYDCHQFRVIRTNHSGYAGLIIGVIALHGKQFVRFCSEVGDSWFQNNSRLSARVVNFITQLDAREQNFVCVDFIHCIFHYYSQAQSIVVHTVGPQEEGEKN